MRRKNLLLIVSLAAVLAALPYLGYSWVECNAEPFDPRSPVPAPALLTVVHTGVLALAYVPARIGLLTGLWHPPFVEFRTPGSSTEMVRGYVALTNPYLYWDVLFSFLVWATAMLLVWYGLVAVRKLWVVVTRC